MKLQDGTIKTVNAWDLETSREDQDQQITRKRKDADTCNPVERPSLPVKSQPQRPAVTK